LVPGADGRYVGSHRSLTLVPFKKETKTWTMTMLVAAGCGFGTHRQADGDTELLISGTLTAMDVESFTGPRSDPARPVFSAHPTPAARPGPVYLPAFKGMNGDLGANQADFRIRYVLSPQEENGYDGRFVQPRLLPIGVFLKLPPGRSTLRRFSTGPVSTCSGTGTASHRPRAATT